MIKYRMHVYEPRERPWITCDIFASDDASAKQLAQARFDELIKERIAQGCPKLDSPALDRFTLFEGERLICEIVNHNI
jgi:hypothetical protein